MIQTNATLLHVGQNNQPKIIKDISDVKFWDLKILALPQNRISSIEILSTIWLPKLQGLNLYDNCITSIKPLSKMHSPNLFVLSLQQNLITDFSPLVTMINQKQIREIGINYRRDTLCCDDFSWFVKIDNINFSQLWIGQYNRLRMRALEQVCKKKFININIIICSNT